MEGERRGRLRARVVPLQGEVAGDVDDGTAHVEDTVEAEDEGDAGLGHADGAQDQGEGDHARAGHAGGAHRGQGVPATVKRDIVNTVFVAFQNAK